MADHTKNISNTVNVFGLGPSTKWGQAVFPQTMTWGVSKWGEGPPLGFQFVKLVSNGPTFSFDKYTTDVNRVWSQTLTVESDMELERLQNGIWRHVFTSDTTDAEQRAFASWTAGSDVTTSYTCLTAGGTSWSET